MVQAATSLNQQTLSFVPKLIVTAICLAIFGGSILVLLTAFTRDLYAQIPALVRSPRMTPADIPNVQEMPQLWLLEIIRPGAAYRASPVSGPATSRHDVPS